MCYIGCYNEDREGECKLSSCEQEETEEYEAGDELLENFKENRL